MTTNQLNSITTELETERALSESLLRNKLNRDNWEYLLRTKDEIIARQVVEAEKKDKRILELEKKVSELQDLVNLPY